MWENILELAFHLLPHRQGSTPHDIRAVELVQRPPCPGTLLPLCRMCHHQFEANDSHQGLWTSWAVLAPGPTPHPSSSLQTQVWKDISIGVLKAQTLQPCGPHPSAVDRERRAKP